MATSLLDMIKDMAARPGMPRPTAVASASGGLALQWLGLANEAGRDLVREHLWEELVGEYSFTSAAGSQQLTLSSVSNFVSIVPETMWNTTTRRKIRGPETPQRWQALIVSSQPVVDNRFRIRDGKLYFLPNTTAGDTIRFEYRHNGWVLAADTTPKTAFTADTDTCRLDEEALILSIKWRWKREQGLEYGEDFNDFQRRLYWLKGENQPHGTVTLNSHHGAMPIGNVPESDFPSS